MVALQSLDWSEILNKLSALATSGYGKDALLKLSPLKSKEEALVSFEEIQSAQHILAQGLRPHFESLDLYNTWLQRLQKKAMLKTLEIKDIRLFCHEVIAFKTALSNSNTAWSQNLSDSLMNAEEPLSAIDHLITPNGEIRSEASEKLYRLIQEKERLQQEVHKVLDRAVKDYDMESYLQDKYVTTREGRWVLPVKSGMQHFVDGVIHGSSQTKQTVFMEPEKVIPLNNRLRQIEVEIEDEIERLLNEISEYLAGQAHLFQSSAQIMLVADQKFAQAQLALQMKAQPCFFDERIELKSLRHPLLSLQIENTVPNSVVLDHQQSILLLTGPNAGGKTVLLKAIGLAAQMARCGLLICAEESSKIPFFKTIHISIGDSQSVEEELSTFAAHLKILSQGLTLQGRDHLLLVDEICGSTDPDEGSALARAFIEKYAKSQIFAVITSHLSPLKTGWSKDDGVVNGSLEYDSKTGRPTYQFIPGVAGDSLALQTAQRVGVDRSVTERAMQLLSPAAQAKLRGLDELEKMKSDLRLLQESLRAEVKKAESLQKKYQEEYDQFLKEKETQLDKTLRQAQKQVEQAIENAKAEDILKKHRELANIKQQLPQIVKAKPIQTQNSIDSAEKFSQAYPPGSKVYVPALQSDAIIQSQPSNKGEVLVLSGSVRLQVHWQDIQAPHKPQNPTSQLVRKSGSFSVALSDHEKTLDVRGQDVESALAQLEISLDQATEHREDRIKVIHGHGTEALKRAIRAYLSRSVYVKKWKAGTPQNGGDGVTWVELADQV